MRSKDEGLISGLSGQFEKNETLALFRKIAAIHYFELNVKKAFDAGFIKCPVYLSLGQESVAPALALVYEKPFIFGQHRCHDLYLAYGGDPASLIDELLHRPTGCSRGMGGSASIQSPAIGMFGHSGLMGDQIPIAVGFALGTRKRTLAVMGDASAEEDYVLGALGYAAHKKLPVLFVCMDNGLSILTKVGVRRNWNMVDVARAFGMEAIEITDDPWLVMHHAKRLSGVSPAFMNIHTARNVWHSGTGNDGAPEWDRYALIKEELGRLGFETQAVEEEIMRSVAALWTERMTPVETT